MNNLKAPNYGGNPVGNPMNPGPNASFIKKTPAPKQPKVSKPAKAKAPKISVKQAKSMPLEKLGKALTKK